MRSPSQIYLHNLMMLQEATKWKELAKAGKISPKAMERIRNAEMLPDRYYVKHLIKTGKAEQAKEYLKKKGIVMPLHDWLRSVDKGLENIIAKHGISKTDTLHPGLLAQKKKRELNKIFLMKKFGISEERAKRILEKYSKFKDSLAKLFRIERSGNKMTDVFQSAAAPDPFTGKSTIHVIDPDKVPEHERLLHTLVKKHEVDEALEANKIWKAMTKKRGEDMALPLSMPSVKQYQHMSPRVLSREKEFMDYVQNVYNTPVSTTKSGLIFGRWLPKTYRIGGKTFDLGRRRKLFGIFSVPSDFRRIRRLSGEYSYKVLRGANKEEYRKLLKQVVDPQYEKEFLKGLEIFRIKDMNERIDKYLENVRPELRKSPFLRKLVRNKLERIEEVLRNTLPENHLKYLRAKGYHI